jgi:hypothetical protein
VERAGADRDGGRVGAPRPDQRVGTFPGYAKQVGDLGDGQNFRFATPDGVVFAISTDAQSGKFLPHSSAHQLFKNFLEHVLLHAGLVSPPLDASREDDRCDRCVPGFVLRLSMPLPFTSPLFKRR